MTKKKKNLELDTMTPQEWMRFEIAKELGFEDKIRENGWGALSAQESGRIGGMIASRNRKRTASAADTSLKTDSSHTSAPIDSAF